MTLHNRFVVSQYEHSSWGVRRKVMTQTFSACGFEVERKGQTIYFYFCLLNFIFRKHTCKEGDGREGAEEGGERESWAPR